MDAQPSGHFGRAIGLDEKSEGDTLSDERLEESDEPMPTKSKIIAGLVGCVVLLIAMYGMLRISSPPIAPDRKAPAGHYAFDCALCHSVSADAPAGE